MGNDGFSPLYFFSVNAGKTYVYLDVLDFDGDPNEITKTIGLEPTKSWKRGDPAAPNSIFTCNQSGWRLHSDLPLSESVEAHLDNVLSKLETNADMIKYVSSQFTTNIQITDQAHHTEKFSLSNKLLYRVYNLGLSIEFVYYHIGYKPQEE